MVGMRLAVFALLIVAGLALSGCLQDPGDYGGAMIEASPKVISSFDCTCFLCTNSTGSWWKELRWWRNELTDGACFFKEECTLAFLTSYFDDNEKNYVREFGIGQGGSYTEFEEANLRCNFRVDYVIKVLYAKGRAPFYEKQGGWLFKDDTKEGGTIMCALEKGVIPIYVIYTEGTYLESDWIREFMKEASIEGPVFVTPEAMFDESVAGDIKGQIDAIYDGCGSERERICVEWEERTTYVDHPTLGQRATTYKECVKYDETMVRGCKVALFPKQGNPGVAGDGIFENLDSVNEKIDKVDMVITTLVINQGDYDCRPGLALAEAMNRSRYVLNRYGKPTFLVLSIDSSCTNYDEIALEAYSAINIMRSVGIVGMAYSNYFDYENSPLSTSQRPYDIQKNDMWFKLCKHYNDEPYRKDPVVFQSDGVNISHACDVLSVYGMMAVDEESVKGYDGRKAAIGETKNLQIEVEDPATGEMRTKTISSVNEFYKLCIPEVDFGEIEGVAKKWNGWESYKISTEPSDCSSQYQNVEPLAEQCGLSRHLLRAFANNGVRLQSCSEWYDVEGELGEAGMIDLKQIRPEGRFEDELGIVAFMYVLKKRNPDYYGKIINGEPIEGTLVTREKLYAVCNGIEKKKESEGAPSVTMIEDTPCKVLKAYSEYREDCMIEDLYKGIADINVERPPEELDG